MDLLQQLMKFLRNGLTAIFDFVQLIWTWSVKEIAKVPWDRIDTLAWWQIVILVVAGCAILYLLYRVLFELIDAGQKALGAIVTLLSVVAKTLPPVLLAGLTAAGAAWVLNNVHF